jgi:hypothetical protein
MRAALADWYDPRVLKIGADYRREAHELADEFNSYGADATRLLGSYRDLPREKQDVCVPVKFADAIMAVLLSLPSAKRGRPLKPSTQRVRRLVADGLSKREAARHVSAFYSAYETPEQIRRRFRSSGPKVRKRPKPTKPRK